MSLLQGAKRRQIATVWEKRIALLQVVPILLTCASSRKPDGRCVC